MEVRIEQGEVVVELTTDDGAETVSLWEATRRILEEDRFDEEEDLPRLTRAVRRLFYNRRKEGV